MIRLPHVMDVTHNCELAPDWGPPHTVAIPFTRAVPSYDTPAGKVTRLEGVRCDGSPIAVWVNDDGQEVTW